MPNKTRKYFIAKGLLTIFEKLDIEPWIFNVDKDLSGDSDYTLGLYFMTKSEKHAKKLWMSVCVELLAFCQNNDLSVLRNDIHYGELKNNQCSNWADIAVTDELTTKDDPFGMNE